MKTVLVLFVTGAAFAGGYGYGRWYAKPAAAAANDKILYYVDAMHPWYKSDKPGIAPDCGMKLEPVYADGTMGATGNNLQTPPPGAIQISAEKQQLIGMRYGAAEWSTEGQTVRFAGR